MRGLFVGALVILSIFGAQLLRLQAFDSSAMAQAAMYKRTVKTSMPAMRGQITDTHGVALAQSAERYTVSVDPTAVIYYGNPPSPAPTAEEAAQAKEKAAGVIATSLDLPRDTVLKALNKQGTRYVILKKDVEPNAWRALSAEGINGINAERTAIRTYPQGMSVSQIVGWVRPQDQKGASGIEFLNNKTLAGTNGVTIAEQGRNGQIIPGSDRTDIPTVDGRNVRLTLDMDVQWFATNVLAKRVTELGAEGGDVVVLDVKTGRIVAAASYPSFDPTKFSTSNQDNLVSRAFAEGFEPGSTGKAMTMAAAIEEKAITPDTGVIVPNRLPRAGIAFKDNEDHATEYLTATGVIAKSSNIGTMLVGERVPPAVMESYYRKFGVGSHTASGYPGETTGWLQKASSWDACRRYTVLFGQGYSVNAIQAAGVFQTIANGGVRMPATLVEGTYAADGTYTANPLPSGIRVVSPDTASKVSRMLEEVTGKQGTARDARIPGYRVAGKTGTADRFDEKLGRYNGFTASFIGYAPADNPKYVVAVIIQKPSTGMFGGALAGPVFNQVMTYLLERDGIPPTGVTPSKANVFSPVPLSSNDPAVLSDAEARRRGLVG